MNTPKKEDMEKERQDLIIQTGYLAFHILQPLASILPAVGRLAYLNQEIEKVTPKYKPNHKLEVTDAPLATEKAIS